MGWISEFQTSDGANFLYEVIRGSPLNHGFLHMFTIDLSQKIEPLFAILKSRPVWMDKSQNFFK